tara:strand:- start:13001 stop:14863 length:1863 start_codon:yes stop_codon:yes gene_type:complete
MANFEFDPQAFVQNAAARGTTRTDATKNWETLLGLGSTAMHVANPILANNPRQQSLRSSYVNAYDAYNKISPAVNAFSRYEQASELLNPDTGGAAASRVASLENMTQTAADALSWTNPVLGVSTWLNSLTEDEENPYGQIPILKDLEKGKDWVAAKLDETDFGQALREKSKAAWDATIGKVMDTETGRAIYDGTTDALTAVDKYLLMGLAPGLHDAKEGLAYKGYVGLDRAVRGYLPGGITPAEYKIEKHGMAEKEWSRDFLRQGIDGEPGGGSMDKLWEMQTIWSNRNPPNRSTNPLADEVWSDDSPGGSDVYYPDDVAKLYVDAGGDVSDAIDFAEKHGVSPETIADNFDPLYTSERRFEAYGNGEISNVEWVENAWDRDATPDEFQEMMNEGISSEVIYDRGIESGLEGKEVMSRTGMDRIHNAIEILGFEPDSPEWFSMSPVKMKSHSAEYSKVQTLHLQEADGKWTPVQRMPAFWNWLDSKRSKLGRAGFENYMHNLYGGNPLQNPHVRAGMNFDKPSAQLRGPNYDGYSGEIQYTHVLNVHKWSRVVSAFYQEMTNKVDADMIEQKGRDFGMAAEISSSMPRFSGQDILMRELELPTPSLPKGVVTWGALEPVN